MKKAMVLLLVAILFLLPAAEADQLKSWSVLIPSDNNTHMLLNIIKSDDKFSIVSVEINTELSGYSFTENGGVYEILMEDGVHKARIMGDKLIYQLLPDSYTVMLGSISDFDSNFTAVDGSFDAVSLDFAQQYYMPQPQKENKAKPLTIPSGVYIAGEDFPAGVYRIELAEGSSTGHIKLYENKVKVKEAFAYIYDYDLGAYYGNLAVGKIEILEGNALEVRNTTIVLKPYEGLK